MALQGNIDSFSVVDVLQLLGTSSKSGRLVVDGDRGSGSLWLTDGEVTCGTTTRPGEAPIGAEPVEVLFDLLRFAEGSFVFEADVEPTELARSAAGTPMPVADVLAATRDALAEWDGIVAVVPSLRSRIWLVADLAPEHVTLDRVTWGGVVALAAASTDGAVVTVGAVGRQISAGELPVMRLVRDLVDLGVVAVGEEVPVEPQFEPAFAHTPFDAPLEPVSFDPPSYEPDRFEPAGFETAGFGTAPFAEPPGPSPYEAAPIGAPAYAAPPIGEPVHGASAPDAPVAPVAAPPIGAVRSPEEFDVFAPFDPFGTAESEDDDGDDDGVDADAVYAEPAFAEPAFAEPAFAEPAFAEAAFVEPEAHDDDLDDAAQRAEFARQLAMLSPRAAEAVASAEAGPSTEDEERARVARFLGSV